MIASQTVQKNNSILNSNFDLLGKYFIDKLLTKREMEVLKYIVLGYTAKRIGQSLQISFRTVEAYIEILKTKLDCASKSDIPEIVFKSGLILHLGLF